ncbi:LRR receptor-like serine/threonine-protein kinase FEI 1 [Vitis vinifera]|uniref:LRR receptor-like serine/threonine-protein kinase FEI 1 n=1 Tax=Vitis vinifera TaxID=29760 RepID=A0A438DAQ8_VITVI|nr:LRR receptor-like serine/threonine-protein kinase FEI 1 [Vitis vinifera]
MAFPSLWNLRMKNKTEASLNHLTALGLASLVPTTELEFCHFVCWLWALCHLSLLQNINLARNSINGRIPVGLSHCYNLEEIYFEHNQLIGNLPSELGDLPRLRILDVAANNLTGVIAPTFGNLTSLTVLSLARKPILRQNPK